MTGFVTFDGEKGGTGKSTGCASFVDWATARNLPTLLIDADKSNPDVLRRFNGSVECEFVSIRDEGGWMKMLDIVYARRKDLAEGVVVVNLPSNVAHSFPEERIVLHRSLVGVGFVPSLIWMLDREDDSVNLLGGCLADLSSYLTNVVPVRNLNFGKPDTFTWDKSELRKQVLAAPNLTTVEVDFPRLLPEIAFTMRKALGVPSFRSHDESLMGLGNYVTLEDWINRTDACWDRLRPDIIPSVGSNRLAS